MLRSVRGQVAVATTPGAVRRVRLTPAQPAASEAAVQAIMDADMVTIGPGSWFSSVIPHILVPDIAQALNETSATVAVILNLSPEAGETHGFTTERHIHVFAQHAPALRVDTILVDDTVPATQGERENLRHAAEQLGAEVEFRSLREMGEDGVALNRHDPLKLAAAYQEVMER